MSGEQLLTIGIAIVLLAMLLLNLKATFIELPPALKVAEKRSRFVPGNIQRYAMTVVGLTALFALFNVLVSSNHEDILYATGIEFLLFAAGLSRPMLYQR